MLKSGLKRVLLLSVGCLIFSQVVQAENPNQEGKVVYQFQYDYDGIYDLLSLDRKGYDQYWNKGLSIAEMAEKQGVSRRELISYFVGFHYNEMQRWRKKGTLSEKDYFHLVYMLQEDIMEFIDRNPNK
jgi:hypothetical protein